MQRWWIWLFSGIFLGQFIVRTFGLAGEVTVSSDNDPGNEMDLRAELGEMAGRIPESFFEAFREAAHLQKIGHQNRDRFKLKQSQAVYRLILERLKRVPGLYFRIRGTDTFRENWRILHLELGEPVPEL